MQTQTNIAVNSIKKFKYSIILANALDHYDTAIYAFLLPILIDVFFASHKDLTFAILLSGGIIIRPLSSILFSRLIYRYPKYQLLRISIIGCAITTFCMGLIWQKNIDGNYLFCLLIILRLIQNFFAAAESSIADIYILEISSSKNYASMGGYYYACSLMGYFCASFAATLVVTSSKPALYLHIPFLLGIIPGIIALGLRFANVENLEKILPLKHHNNDIISIFISLWENRIKLLQIFCSKGVSALTYYFIFVFHLKFIPEITQISKSEIYLWHNILLLIDIVLLVIMGKLCDHFNIKKWLILNSMLLAIFILPYCYLLKNATFIKLAIIEILLVTLAVGFSSGVMPYLIRQTEGCKDRYLLINVGGLLGSEILGRLTPGICMLLYSYSNNVIMPGLYFLFILLCATYCTFYCANKYEKSK